MTDKNMEIWEQVCITDKDTTKPIEGKGFAGTSINPTSTYEKLTKLFGPCGMGWGYTVLDEYYREGHTDGENTTVLHVVKVGLWYYPDPDNMVKPEGFERGNRSEPIEAFGQTYFTRHTIKGWTTDEEAPKKSLTDAITKAASMLGVSADIYSGKWDGCKYQNKDKSTPTNKAVEAFHKTTTPACPKCSSLTIFYDKKKKGELYCWKAKGGCGARYDSLQALQKQDMHQAMERSAFGKEKELPNQDDIPYGKNPDESKIADLKAAIEEKIKEDFPKIFWKDWVNDHCIKEYGESKEVDAKTGYHYDVDTFSLDRLERVWAYINPSK